LIINFPWNSGIDIDGNLSGGGVHVSLIEGKKVVPPNNVFAVASGDNIATAFKNFGGTTKTGPFSGVLQFTVNPKNKTVTAL
jgi:hypothetical protein